MSILFLILAAHAVDQQVVLVDRDGTTETRVIDARIEPPIRYTEAGRVLIVHTDRDLVFRDGVED